MLPQCQKWNEQEKGEPIFHISEGNEWMNVLVVLVFWGEGNMGKLGIWFGD